MNESKQSISTSQLKKRDLTSLSPFDSYQSITRQKNITGASYLTSSRKKKNKSLFDGDDPSHNINNICLKHSFPINNVCFTCNFQLMCIQCLKSNQSYNIVNNNNNFMTTTSNFKHKDHDIRNIQKSSNYIKNILIQSLIKLQAKCNILTNLNQQLNTAKIDLFHQSNQYKQSLIKNFQYLKHLIQQKQKQLILRIDQIYQQHNKKLSSTIEQIKSTQNYYQKCQKNINLSLQNLQSTQNNQINKDLSLCYYYSQKKQSIEDIIKQTEIQQFKKKIYQVKYKIQNNQLNQIVIGLDQIQIGYDLKYTHILVTECQSRPSSVNKLMSKVKSQSDLKFRQSRKKIKKPIKYLDLEKTQKIDYAQSRVQKPRETFKINGTFCTSTPKQMSREKRIELLKKSPDGSSLTALLKKRKKSFGKMISMPASPAKDQKERLSPKNYKVRDQVIQGMKKKQTCTKKKK